MRKENKEQRREGSEMEQDDLELKGLGNFYGTEGYSDVFGFNVTDGVAYIMKNGYSWFVTDFLIVAGMKFKDEEFMSIKLKIEDSKAEMIVTDGNEKKLYTQKYEWTNAKKDLSLYLTNGVLMLSQEY